jgi:hypothetical protein
VLEECCRISNAGAQLVFTFNTDKTMIEFYSVLEEVLFEKNMLNEIKLMKEHIYKKRSPVEEYAKRLNENGYVINEIDCEEFAYKFVDGTALLNHFLITLSFIESWKDLIPKDRQGEIFEEIENRLNELAEINGSLTLTIPFVLIDCKRIRKNN